MNSLRFCEEIMFSFDRSFLYDSTSYYALYCLSVSLHRTVLSIIARTNLPFLRLHPIAWTLWIQDAYHRFAGGTRERRRHGFARRGSTAIICRRRWRRRVGRNRNAVSAEDNSSFTSFSSIVMTTERTDHCRSASVGKEFHVWHRHGKKHGSW